MTKNALYLNYLGFVVCTRLKNYTGISLILNSDRRVSVGRPKHSRRNLQISQRWRKLWTEGGKNM